MTVAINTKKIKVQVDESTWTAGGWLVQYSHDAMTESESTFIPFCRVCDHLEADGNAQVLINNRKIDVQDYIEMIGVSALNDVLSDIINTDQGRDQYYSKQLDHELPDIFRSLPFLLNTQKHSE